MKLQANTRLLLTAARDQAWFDKLDSAKQKEYLEKHPNSKFGDAPAKKAERKRERSNNTDAEIKRIEQQLDKLRDAYDPDMPEDKLAKLEKRAEALEKKRKALLNRQGDYNPDDHL